MMSGSRSDEKVCVGNKACWMLALTLLTASLIVNVIFAAVCYVAIRNLQNNDTAMQNDIASLQEHLLAASEIKHEISDLLAADRDKRALSPSSSSRVAVDVGSVFLSAIKSICKPEGAICIPGAKGEVGHPGRDGIGLPGRDGRDGEPGEDGLPGRDGLPGGTGREGPMGLRGPPGKPGAKGMGLPGKQGPIGIPGVKGGKGDRGEKGAKGHIGGQGIQGVKGIEGEKGERGDRGEQGFTGYKGERGERGTTGEKGEKGEKGEQGSGESELLLPSQCNETNYRILSDSWRKTSISNEQHHRDREGHGGFQPGWHVFADSLGGQMLQTCPPKRRCGTGAPGWLNGSHPTVVGQTSNETVCFRWDDCCQWQVTVDITNCGQFFVYNLPNEPCESDIDGCNLAYCSNA